jgi:hypothetical protein
MPFHEAAEVFGESSGHDDEVDGLMPVSDQLCEHALHPTLVVDVVGNKRNGWLSPVDAACSSVYRDHAHALPAGEVDQSPRLAGKRGSDSTNHFALAGGRADSAAKESGIFPVADEQSEDRTAAKNLRFESDERRHEVVRAVVNGPARGVISPSIIGAGSAEVIDHDRRVVNQTPTLVARPQRKTDLEVRLCAGPEEPARKCKSISSKGTDSLEDHDVASRTHTNVVVAHQLSPVRYPAHFVGQRIS